MKICSENLTHEIPFQRHYIINFDSDHGDFKDWKFPRFLEIERFIPGSTYELIYHQQSQIVKITPFSDIPGRYQDLIVKVEAAALPIAPIFNIHHAILANGPLIDSHEVALIAVEYKDGSTAVEMIDSRCANCVKVLPQSEALKRLLRRGRPKAVIHIHPHPFPWEQGVSGELVFKEALHSPSDIKVFRDFSRLIKEVAGHSVPFKTYVVPLDKTNHDLVFEAEF